MEMIKSAKGSSFDDDCEEDEEANTALLCTSVWDSMRFYKQFSIKCLTVHHDQICKLYNYGIGIHLIKNPFMDDFDALVEPPLINPKDNHIHISFQCRDEGLMQRRLGDMGMKYMVVLCNCENILILQSQQFQQGCTG
ncbi:B-box type zinc finger family protein [Hibiscus syriacus]|uniref:B-box type zinc finger family protein n=1 Tax=Hibiscus syriacus TaxID=106335 RepID=A0A6A3BY95_HIBSY|nr:B-box type zinc finger family protein [Hibiscus syriacus]